MQPVLSYRCSPITGLSYFTFYIQSLFGELGETKNDTFRLGLTLYSIFAQYIYLHSVDHSPLNQTLHTPAFLYT